MHSFFIGSFEASQNFFDYISVCLGNTFVVYHTLLNSYQFNNFSDNYFFCTQIRILPMIWRIWKWWRKKVGVSDGHKWFVHFFMEKRKNIFICFFLLLDVNLGLGNIWIAMVSEIWRHRNKIVFNEEILDFSEILSLAQFLSGYCQDKG